MDADHFYSRRTLMKATGFTFLTSLGLTNASADNRRHALYGTFYLRCPKCSTVDKVEDGTKQHVCSNDKCKTQVFAQGKVTLVCRKQHDNIVDLSNIDVLSSYPCKNCGVDCQGER